MPIPDERCPDSAACRSFRRSCPTCRKTEMPHSLRRRSFVFRRCQALLQAIALLALLASSGLALANGANSQREINPGGGVAANSRLRAVLGERCSAAGIRLQVPRPTLCTDNGAMVAALGAALVEAGRAPSNLGIPVSSSLSVDQVVVH